MLKKSRTQVLDKKAVDFMVLHFSTHEASMLTGLGQHHRESRWKIQASLESPVLDIAVAIDKSVMGRPKVSVVCDTEQLFPPKGGPSKQLALKENFIHKWPFRGNAKGINQKNFFELRVGAGADGGWFPATVTKQRDDGRFEALVEMPNGKADSSTSNNNNNNNPLFNNSVNQVTFDAVKVEDIREASSKQRMDLPERFILLDVPCDNPLLATILIDGSELVTHYFARPTPPPRGTSASMRNKVICRVDKERSKVTADVGHVELSKFLSMEPRAVSNEAGALKHAWTIRIGPWAQHRIEIEKNTKRSKVITLTVDGDVMVEASADEIECTGDHFDCKFNFLGNRCIDFEVYETNIDGEVLDTQATVSQKLKYSVECVVYVPDEKNLVSAELLLNNINFKALPITFEERAEENLSQNLQAMQMSFGLTVPFKVNTNAASGMASNLIKAQSAAGVFGAQAQGAASDFGGWFEGLFGPNLLSGCCRGNCDRNRGHEFNRDMVEAHDLPRYENPRY